MHTNFIPGIAFKCILALMVIFLFTHIHTIINQRFLPYKLPFPDSEQAAD